MNKKVGLSILLIVIVVVLIVLSRHSGTAVIPVEHPIKVGVLLPLSGDTAVSGEKLSRGIALAQKDLAESGVTFVIQDTKNRPADTISAAKQLMDTQHVDVFVGPYGPDEAIALAPVAAAQNKNVFALSYCSSSFVSLKNVWCAYPTAPVQLQGLVPIFKSRNIETIAILDSNTDFGIDSDKTMKAMAAANNYQIVYSDFSKAGERNFRTYVTKIMAQKPDVVFMASDNPTDTLTFMKQLHEAGYKGTRVTFIDVDSKNLEGFGESVEGTIAPGIAPTHFSKEFTKLYHAAYNAEPDYYSAMAWDVVHDVVNALDHRDRNFAVLGDAVTNTAYSDPAIGNFRYLPDRTVLYDMEVNVVKDGKYVPYE
ncbi:MAG TPA: penicillin-binding protein activator [Candidatus Paceibacterota bacterium]